MKPVAALMEICSRTLVGMSDGGAIKTEGAEVYPLPTLFVVMLVT